MARRIFRAAIVAASIALTMPAAAAHAGRYHVYSCRTPSGESAPVDGWSGSVAAGGAFDDYALNTCAQGGALVAALGDATIHAANVDRVTWAFAAPSMTQLAGATLWRAGDTDGGQATNATYQFWLAGTVATSPFDECIFTQSCFGKGELADPMGIPNRIDVPTSSLGTTLSANSSCGGGSGRECPAAKGDPNGYAAVVYLFAADLLLEENEAPHASNASGELAGAPSVQGKSDLAFDATDSGSGVFQAVFSVDG
jgi:hypothetical protein